MLRENKCLMCKYFIFDFSFEHKCKAYPNGIPENIFNEDSSHKDCKHNEYHFEKKENSNDTCSPYTRRAIF